MNRRRFFSALSAMPLLPIMSSQAASLLPIASAQAAQASSTSPVSVEHAAWDREVERMCARINQGLESSTETLGKRWGEIMEQVLAEQRMRERVGLGPGRQLELPMAGG